MREWRQVVDASCACATRASQVFLHCPPFARFFLTDQHNRFHCRARALATAREMELAAAGEVQPGEPLRVETGSATSLGGVRRPHWREVTPSHDGTTQGHHDPTAAPSCHVTPVTSHVTRPLPCPPAHLTL